MQAAAKTGKRLTAEARREHLLDVAAEVIVDKGYEALNMEVIRERAGVSRGLAYTHFENVDDLIVALYEREVAELDRHIDTATAGAHSFEEKVRAATHAYFDFVAERGGLFSTLQLRLTNRWFNPSSRPRLIKLFAFWSEAVQREFGVTLPVAASLARSALMASEMLVDAWRTKMLPRATAEAMSIAFVLAGLRAAAKR